MPKVKYLIAALLMLPIASFSITAKETKKKKSENPFEMVIFNLGASRFSAPKIYGSNFISAKSEQNKNKLIDFGVEVPYFKDYTAFNFDFDIINGQNMIGTDLALGIKFRLPMHFKFGHIAFTNTYKVGLISLFYNRNINNEHETCQFGIMAAPSVGIDYFPIRWFGIYLNYSWNFFDMFLNRRHIEDNNGGEKGRVNKPYGFYTRSISFGLKMTF